jgi:hypothetical protein
VAFYGSCRLGELLCKKTRTFDKRSSLLGAQVKYQTATQTWIIHIRSPKSNLPQGETITLFPVRDKRFCPITFLHRLQKHKRKHGLDDDKLPFFRFASGRNITVRKINTFLKELFPPTGKHKVTGHSFRSGLVSAAANYPDLINDAHLKGWGRWRSSAFLRYEHYDHNQKQYIFNKLIATLPL